MSADGLPLLGRAPGSGLSLAAGHYRNGILLAPLTAELLTAVVTGRAPAIDLQPFRPERFVGGGAALGLH
jgi:glycine oxidase